METAIGFVCAGFFVLSIVAVVGFLIVGRKINASAKAREATYITRAKFEQLRVGMSFQDVVAIAGRPEQELASAGDATGDVTTFRWRGGAVAHALLTFQSGNLISKAQFGL